MTDIFFVCCNIFGRAENLNENKKAEKFESVKRQLPQKKKREENHELISNNGQAYKNLISHKIERARKCEWEKKKNCWIKIVKNDSTQKIHADSVTWKKNPIDFRALKFKNWIHEWNSMRFKIKKKGHHFCWQMPKWIAKSNEQILNWY